MSKISIRYRAGAKDNRLDVDGFDFAKITKRVTATIDPREPAAVELELVPAELLEIEVEAQLKIRGLELPESAARAIYESLRRRFEPETPEPQS